jgi:hypothetical protein
VDSLIDITDITIRRSRCQNLCRPAAWCPKELWLSSFLGTDQQALSWGDGDGKKWVLQISRLVRPMDTSADRWCMSMYVFIMIWYDLYLPSWFIPPALQVHVSILYLDAVQPVGLVCYDARRKRRNCWQRPLDERAIPHRLRCQCWIKTGVKANLVSVLFSEVICNFFGPA